MSKKTRIATNLISTIVCAITFLLVPVAMTGCKTPDTREARIFSSFSDTWIIAHTTYSAWCERVVSGHATKEDERRVDAAWNTFRSAFKLAFHLANQQWGDTSTATVDKLRDDLINLIRRLSE